MEYFAQPQPYENKLHKADEPGYSEGEMILFEWLDRVGIELVQLEKSMNSQCNIRRSASVIGACQCHKLLTSAECAGQDVAV